MSFSKQISRILIENNPRYIAIIVSVLGFAVALLVLLQSQFFVYFGFIDPLILTIIFILAISAAVLLIDIAKNNRRIITAFALILLVEVSIAIYYGSLNASITSLLAIIVSFLLVGVAKMKIVVAKDNRRIISTLLVFLLAEWQLAFYYSNFAATSASVLAISSSFLLIGVAMNDHRIVSIYSVISLAGFLQVFAMYFGVFIGGVFSLQIILGSLGVFFNVFLLQRVTTWSNWPEAKKPVSIIYPVSEFQKEEPIPEPKISLAKTRVAPSEPPQLIRDSEVNVTSGYDVAGESLKLGVKISNTGQLAIMNVTVNLDVPDGFEFDRGTLPSQKLGNISGGSYQSAIFWLKPIRCVDDEFGGSVIFRDALNATHTVEIPRKRIVNVCPMLRSTEHVNDVFKKLKFGSLKRNCASFKFNGNPKTAFALAETRLKGLDPVDRSEDSFQDSTYLGYACYVGETKFSKEQFAAEIQASGTDSVGVLTLSVYSDDDRILTGFFADIMPEVRKHIEVLEEQVCPIATCPKCGANIDPTTIGNDRVYKCTYCGAVSKVAPWLT